MAVIPAPTRQNNYHAEIFANERKEPLDSLKALILADNAEMVVIETEVNWSNN